jgi:hypothetical protein
MDAAMDPAIAIILITTLAIAVVLGAAYGAHERHSAARPTDPKLTEEQITYLEDRSSA